MFSSHYLMKQFSMVMFFTASWLCADTDHSVLLQSVMGTRGAERQSLRSELQMAQEQLEMLKAIQRQMIAQQPPPTPQSRPQSFVSVASSISESGEITDGDNTEDGECLRPYGLLLVDVQCRFGLLGGVYVLVCVL